MRLINNNVVFFIKTFYLFVPMSPPVKSSVSKRRAGAVALPATNFYLAF